MRIWGKRSRGTCFYVFSCFQQEIAEQPKSKDLRLLLRPPRTQTNALRPNSGYLTMTQFLPANRIVAFK